MNLRLKSPRITHKAKSFAYKCSVKWGVHFSDTLLSYLLGAAIHTSGIKALQQEKPRSQSSVRMRIGFWNSVISCPLFFSANLPVSVTSPAHTHSMILCSSYISLAMKEYDFNVFFLLFSLDKLFKQNFRQWLKRIMW